MDGDRACLLEISQLAKRYHAQIIVDEAHSGGIFGPNGQGACYEAEIPKELLLAQVFGLGKAHGCQGGVIACSQVFKNFIVNFSRPFIYSTGPSVPMLLTAWASFELVANAHNERASLQRIIRCFHTSANSTQSISWFTNNTPIQYCRFQSTTLLRAAAMNAQESHMYVVPIFSPTVSHSLERLRITLHSHNTEEEVKNLVDLLSAGELLK